MVQNIHVFKNVIDIESRQTIMSKLDVLTLLVLVVNNYFRRIHLHFENFNHFKTLFAGVRFGRYTLQQRRDCILEKKGIKSVDKENETSPKKSSPVQLKVEIGKETETSNKIQQRNDMLEELVTEICDLHAKHSLITSEFLATLPEKEATHKVCYLRHAIFHA